MAEGARIATDAGADIIDINMGCPARHVTNGYSGSALMRDLDNALRLIEATIAATVGSGNAEDAARLGRQIPQRRGTGTTRGSSRCCNGHGSWPHALPVFDWRRGLGSRAARFPMPLQSRRHQRRHRILRRCADTALGESGADAVMIGRGAQGRPWIPGFIGKYLMTGKRSSDPPLTEQLRHLIELYDATLTHYGVRHGLRHARKHLSWGLNVAARVAGVAPQLLDRLAFEGSYCRNANRSHRLPERCLRVLLVEVRRMTVIRHCTSRVVQSGRGRAQFLAASGDRHWSRWQDR